ncbi:hypothetical protein HN51_068812 [Arachis hypogaea]|nr:14 kDa proline-rich protein DC2.15-like [Arachis hypogaea]QHO10933.1 pEARLI1-like lipid transfer protein [Arachis hypogaea]
MAPKTLSLISVLIGINVLLIAQHVCGTGECEKGLLESQELDCLHPKPKPQPKPQPKPTPSPTPKPKKGGCPRDTLKLGVCSSVLDNRANFSSGVPNTPCCNFFFGLYNFDAALCLCTALKGNILGIHINIPFAYSFLFNFCHIQQPQDFKCLPD